jgi:hypothetical protein
LYSQIPERVKGYLFEYELVKLTRLGATLRYTERVYSPGADNFETFKEGEETQILQWQTKDLAAPHDLWHTANARVNARLYKERERLKKAQNAVVIDEKVNEVHDVSDIDEFFTKHGRGSHMLELDFTADTSEFVPYKKGDGVMSFYQCWTHKHTSYTVKRFAASNGKGVDSGWLSKYLKQIKQNVHPLAFARAKKILELNELATPRSIEVAISVPLDREQLLGQQVSCEETIFSFISIIF